MVLRNRNDIATEDKVKIIDRFLEIAFQNYSSILTKAMIDLGFDKEPREIAERDEKNKGIEMKLEKVKS